jgi:MerR family transcriptional regulator/heat shock protein HspR
MGSGFTYTVEDLATLLGVSPKSIRTWERYVPMSSSRNKTKRPYSENDLKRHFFIQRLLSKGLNLVHIADYIALYPCWLRDDCPECTSKANREGCAKPCWKEKGTFCQVSLEQQDMCKKCRFDKGRGSVVIPLSWMRR